MKYPKLFEEYIKNNELKLSTSRKFSLQFLNNKIPVEIVQELREALDHVWLFNRNGKPERVVSMPYGLSQETLIKMNTYCNFYKLEFTIGHCPVWWNDWTIPITWTKQLPFGHY